MKISRKWIIMMVLFVFVAGLAIGCGGQSTPPPATGDSTGGDTPGESKEPIKIGVNYELSGGVATYGGHTRDGIVMAIDEINAKGGVLGGREIKLVILDNKSEDAEATSVATKLVAQEKVVALLGPATTGGTLAASPVAMENKIPLLTTSATAPNVTVDASGKVKDYIFRICFIDPTQAVVGSEFIYNDLAGRNVAIYYDNGNDYSKGLYSVFKEHFTGLGGKVVSEEGFSDQDKEFRPTLTKFKEANVDAVYLPGYYGQAALIVNQAREIGLNVPFVGADGWDSPDLVKIAGAENLNNTFFTNHYSTQDPNPKIQNFVNSYKAKHGDEPDGFAALGYDAGYLIADAINRAGKAEPEAIKKALEETKGFEAVTGTMSLNELHNPVKEVAIIELIDGKQVLKTKIAAE